jgi:hypothetical protein
MKNTHNLICDFGRFKGERYTRIPVSYLKWMINSDHSHKEIAESELKRRGTVTPEIDITPHAINRMSQNFLKRWLADTDQPIKTICKTNEKDKNPQREGLYSWTLKKAMEALNKDNHTVNGIEFVFEMDGCWPVLITVK